jgi:hypothetical protein
MNSFVKSSDEKKEDGGCPPKMHVFSASTCIFVKNITINNGSRNGGSP